MACLPLTVAKLPTLVRIGVFLLGLVLLWLPISLPFYWLADTGRLALGGSIATGLLYLLFLLMWPIWSRRVYGLTQPWRSLGLVRRFGLLVDALIGFALGVAGVTLLAAIQWTLGWASFQGPATSPLQLVTEAVLVGWAVGVAEEVLFRGWLLLELERDYHPALALWVNGLIFAAVHFIKPLPAILATLPQFFGLLLLGFTLVWARRAPSMGLARTTSALGWPIGLHGGLVGTYYVVSVGQLFTPTGAVPEWVTGIQQNPLAGLMGIGLLGAIAALFYQKARLRGG